MATKEDGASITIDSQMIDIGRPEIVEIEIRGDGKVVWINVDGICRLRASRIKELKVIDQRRNDNG